MTDKKTAPPKTDHLASDLKRLFGHLSRRRHWQLAGLMVFILIGAMAEMATLGAVVPFLALLADPTLAHKYPLMLKLFGLLGWHGGNGVALYASIFFAIVAISAAVVRVTLLWVSNRFTFALGGDIGSEIYRRTIYQPYSFHVARNTSEIIAGITTKVNIVVGGVISPLVQGLISLIIAFSILGVLMHIDAFTASAAIAGFALLYTVTTFVTRRRLRANSKIIARNATLRVQAVQEGLGGIRDVLIDGAQPVYVARFRKFDGAQRRAQAVNSFISLSPRYVIEALGMVLIVALAWVLKGRAGGLNAAIPVLGALALGAQKLLPQMQLIYLTWSSVSGNRAILSDVLGLLEQPISPEYLMKFPASEGGSLSRDDSAHITLHNISFRYCSDARDVIRNLSLHIPRGSRVGLIGKTGSGKSTLLDLIMGLLEPTDGHIEIGGRPLTSQNRRAWQARIAHVPQAIYLSDAPIAENIAFGIDPARIDMVQVQTAARKAQIANFIDTLPDKYQTPVGERGIRLSGGQRQRIGIARALYKRSKVLVLDEATSALDDDTERAVIQAIETLGKEITVLMIAHRVSTLSSCDMIVELGKGKILRVCGYRELIHSNRVMSRVDEKDLGRV